MKASIAISEEPCALGAYVPSIHTILFFFSNAVRSDDSRCQTEERALLAQRQFVAGSKILGKLKEQQRAKEKYILYLYKNSHNSSLAQN